jgi:hypothetical protein
MMLAPGQPAVKTFSVPGAVPSVVHAASAGLTWTYVAGHADITEVFIVIGPGNFMACCTVTSQPWRAGARESADPWPIGSATAQDSDALRAGRVGEACWFPGSPALRPNCGLNAVAASLTFLGLHVTAADTGTGAMQPARKRPLDQAVRRGADPITG